MISLVVFLVDLFTAINEKMIKIKLMPYPDSFPPFFGPAGRPLGLIVGCWPFSSFPVGQGREKGFVC